MNKTNFILNFLLLFVGVSVVGVSVVGAADTQNPADKPPYYLSNRQLDESLGVNDQALKPARYVRLVYFHRVPGCSTCQLMSRYIYQTVQTKFPEYTKNKTLVLRYMNFEDPQFASFAQAFNVKSPTLIAIEVQDGKDVRYWNLNQIWLLAADKAKFYEYVETKVRDILEGK